MAANARINYRNMLFFFFTLVKKKIFAYSRLNLLYVNIELLIIQLIFQMPIPKNTNVNDPNAPQG